MKNPLTPAGIEPATFRFVAQHLNHCATAVPVPFPVQYIMSIMSPLCRKRGCFLELKKVKQFLDRPRGFQKVQAP